MTNTARLGQRGARGVINKAIVAVQIGILHMKITILL